MDVLRNAPTGIPLGIHGCVPTFLDLLSRLFFYFNEREEAGGFNDSRYD
jgi:hypothetical protein